MIDVESVSVKIGKKLIVDGVNVEVNEGEFVGIIGPNGSGKSTLMKSLYRVLKPVGGTVYIKGNNIWEIPLKQCALQTAVVAQHNIYNFDFMVKDVVMMGRAPHKKELETDNDNDRAIVAECLAKVGMTDYAERTFSTLSGGEQQRVILAKALAQETPCILLDEPTNHLDIKYQLQLMDVVKKLGLTTLCALHDLNIAAAYCDRIFIMKNGKLQYFGSPEDVLTPEIIREVYGVESHVARSSFTGLLNIEYKPGYV